MAAPKLSGLTAPTFDENTVNATPQLINADVTLTDAEGDFDGGSLTVSGLLAEDRVSLASGLVVSLSGGVVYYDADGAGAGAAVAIGTATGGAGTSFVVTFNAAATTAMVEAVVESLTYQTVSDSPTTGRTLSIQIADAAGGRAGGVAAFTLAGTSPLAGIDVGNNAAPVFADLDDDGDLDLVVGSDQGYITYYQNTGTATAPTYVQVTGAANPLPAAYVGWHATPHLVDIDNDGDLDLFSGDTTGEYRYWENTGTASAAVFTERTGTANPLSGIQHASYSNPAFVDLDNDGDLDLVALSSDRLDYYVNSGTASAPVFTLAGANPLAGFAAGGTHGGTIDFYDVDADGDLDATIGALGTDPRYLENTGSASSPVFVERTGAANRVAVVSVGGLVVSSPHFVDINGDGVIDLVTGEYAGNLRLFYASQVGVPIVVGVKPQNEPIVGGAPDESLTGDDQDDWITGGAGADTLRGAGGVDIIDGGDDADQLDGGSGDDVLTGGAGDDLLAGSSGSDAMAGGAGDDVYYVTDAGDTVAEAADEGTDLVNAARTYSLGANVENLTLMYGQAIDGTGNALANVITGNSGANVLSGLGGEDALYGGLGHDALYGGDDADSLYGGAGNDDLNGEAGADLLYGHAGADRLDGGAGADRMEGGDSGDTYVVDDAGDVVVEAAGGGSDTVEAWVSHVLADNVEGLTLMGAAAIDGTGNAGRNTLTGNGADNRLDGGAGDDLLSGGLGADTLVGGAGADRLSGGDGADLFRFSDDDVAASLVVDRILDLDFAGGDVIDLSAIDGAWAALSFVTRFSKQAGQVLVGYAGGVTTLNFDLDGDGKADYRLQIDGDHRASTGNLYTGPGDTDGGWVL
jgi:Ca2+-binding RTX toxin-like protein